MSVGRPVVSTNVGSIPEAVAEGKTGFLVAPDDASQFATRVLRLLNDPPLARSMGAAGREIIVARWSVDAMVQGYERLIESIYEKKMFLVGR
jgi:glycosyltransferase involved in cell wall biosynthesis